MASAGRQWRRAADHARGINSCLVQQPGFLVKAGRCHGDGAPGGSATPAVDSACARGCSVPRRGVLCSLPQGSRCATSVLPPAPARTHHIRSTTFHHAPPIPKRRSSQTGFIPSRAYMALAVLFWLKVTDATLQARACT